MAQKNQVVHAFVVLCLALAALLPGPRAQAAEHPAGPYAETSATPGVTARVSGDPGPLRQIHLKSRDFAPSAAEALPLDSVAASDQARAHVLLQLDFIPRQAAKEALAGRGIELLAYVPDYAWIASIPVSDASAVLDGPGVVWLGPLTVEDKLAPSIRADRWAPFNLAPDETAALHVFVHRDETLQTGRELVRAYGGRIAGEVEGIHSLVVEMPKAAVRALAAQEAVQWIEPVGPPLTGTNDGSRPHIRANALNAPPYGLRGSGVDVLVYDTGQAGDHVDFGTRLIHGDTDTVSDHSTHVAGIIGGSGANSVGEGGTPLQWRGMAAEVDLISYGTGYPGSGKIFYENVPDIEADWAAAQNTYGADLGNGSVGSNVYANYPETGCYLMGKYGASAVLIDQIVRGDNSVVGIGDKYIAIWSAGNERGWDSTCDDRSYDLVAPPAAAKNPIHVGASNTNNTSQYEHTSWGPTADGRIKPIVTAGGCQTTGDMGVTSTDNNPVNSYMTKCGTSMAAPAVAGGVALMLEHYRDVYNTSGRFWPSTAKAILMQTASDEGRPGPDYAWGYGLVDIQAAVDLISRKAFRQDSVDDDDVDVYSLVVPGDDPLRVSLAWDDHEATVNANPTLINDLDLELVSPGGVTWRPWILDPDHPTTDATRGVNRVDNQEQVAVPSPEIGTWLVRVRGTTVPEGPQDYSLACEGCKPLNVGVCQSRVDGTVTAVAAQSPDASDGIGDSTAAPSRPTPVEEPLSEGEVWQRALETQAAAVASAQGEDSAAVAAGLAALEAARNVGPEAVVALLDTLRGPALDALIDEIQEAQEALREAAPPPPGGLPITPEQEGAALDARRTQEAARAVRSVDPVDGPSEGLVSDGRPVSHGDGTAPPPIHTNRTVGKGCEYPTVTEAIAAADPGDRLLIEGGVKFLENVIIKKSLQLKGGYPGCHSGSTAPTTINGGGSGRVFEISGGVQVTLEAMNITNGSTKSDGAGIRFAPGDGGGTLTLSGVVVSGNHAGVGGGLWVGKDADVNGSGVEIHSNTAETYGGGVRLYGGRATFEDSRIHDNTAPKGAGVYATKESGHTPELNLPASADLYDNQALTGSGLGGGVYIREGSASLAAGSDIYSNEAIMGGGAHLITATLTIDGHACEVSYNTSVESGGGVYAQGSRINLDDDAEIEYNNAGTGGSGSGGGAYLDDSQLYSDKASINNNTAAHDGGGIHAINGSIFDMDLGVYTCLGVRCSSLYNNMASSGYGGGAHLDGSQAYLDNTFVETNQARLGGGVYALDGTVYANSSLFARNYASVGTGCGIRLYTDATLSGVGNTFAYNDLGGASTGRAIDLYSADLTLNCSIIWGHATSIGAAGQDVTYSNVQGGYAGNGNLDVNPLFVSPGSYDYHLQAASPVIDRCLAGHGTDFDAEARPIVRRTAASPYDMGADEVSGEMSVGLNGGGCAYATIQQAVNAADDEDTVRVSEGVYFENLSVVNKDITLEGGYDSSCTTHEEDTTRIEGSVGTGSTVHVGTGRVTLRNLEVSWGSGMGGGLRATGGAAVTLEQTEIRDNHGTYGGGVYVDSASVLTLTNEANVTNNTATVHGGGARVWGRLVGVETYSDISHNCAPHGGGVSVPGGVLALDGSDMQGNEAGAADGAGGGIHAAAGGSISLSANAWVYDGSAYQGGGLYLDGATAEMDFGVVAGNDAAQDGGGVHLTNGSTLTGTQACSIAAFGDGNTGRYGGGIYVEDSRLTFMGQVRDNEASHSGGGIAAFGSSDLTLSGATLRDNAAAFNGGGIYAQDSTLTLDRTQLHHNTGQQGGALFQEAGSGTADVRNTLIYSNTSTVPVGAGIRAEGGTVTMTHTTLAHNINGAGYSQSNTQGFAFNSIAWGNAGGGFSITSGDLTGTCSLDQTGNAGPALDPWFVAPGAGQDYHLRAGSPAIDRCATGLPDDLDGGSRPSGGGYDAGAYEYQNALIYLPLVHRAR